MHNIFTSAVGDHPWLVMDQYGPSHQLINQMFWNISIFFCQTKTKAQNLRNGPLGSTL